MSVQSEFRIIMKSEGKGAIEIMNEAAHKLAIENLDHDDYLIYEAGEKLRDEEIATLRSNIANCETARQEDARRLEQITAEREAMREALAKAIPHLENCAHHHLDDFFLEDQLLPEIEAALKGGKG